MSPPNNPPSIPFDLLAGSSFLAVILMIAPLNIRCRSGIPIHCTKILSAKQWARIEVHTVPPRLSDPRRHSRHADRRRHPAGTDQLTNFIRQPNLLRPCTSSFRLGTREMAARLTICRATRRRCPQYRSWTQSMSHIACIDIHRDFPLARQGAIAPVWE